MDAFQISDPQLMKGVKGVSETVASCDYLY